MKRAASGRSLTAVLAILSGITVVSVARPAAAECVTNADCGAGLVCAPVPTDCTAQDCPEGQTCAPAEPCVTTEIRECVPAPCSTDADCGEGLVCMTESWGGCSGAIPTCPADTTCPELPPPDCTTYTRQICAPRYVAPCTADADCGEGFRCVEEVMTSCSGSGGGTGTSVDGGTTEPTEPVCTSEPTGNFRCQIIETACTADSECPSGWTCGDNPEGVACAPEPCPVDPTQPAKLCLPPYWDLGGRSGGSLDEGGSSFSPAPQTGNPGSGSSSSSDSDGSCQVSPALGATSGATAFAGIFGLLLATALRRRRARERAG